MTRRMSCSLTIDAVKERRKTVTRRHVDTWQDLRGRRKPTSSGDRLILVEKAQGLPAGAKQVILAEVEVVDVRVEPISLLTADVRYGRQEVALEGLDMTPAEFVSFWRRSHGYGDEVWDDELILDPPPVVQCRRIQWRYIDEATP